MTQKELLLELFRANGNVLTLGQLLAHPSGVGYKCTSRFSDLRRQGFVITCTESPVKASDNKYQLFEQEENGQLRLA